jgi:septum site-determining protein MinC
MAVENASPALALPHLPPVVTGGRPVNAPAAVEEDAPQAVGSTTIEKSNSLIIDGNVRSGQSIVHPEGDVTVVGRVASGAEIVAGGSVHVYGALQGRVIAGISGSPSARIFCREARAELICIGGVYVTAETMDPRIEGRSLDVRLAGEELKLRILD